MVPDYLHLASLLNKPSTRAAALDALFAPAASTGSDEAPSVPAKTLAALAPYLTLSTLLALRGHSALAGVDFSGALDVQRDWATSAECPAYMRDGYLVPVLGGEWEAVREGMKDVAEGMGESVKKGMVLEAEGGVKPVEVTCESAEAFKEELKKASGGVLDKLDWSNVILGGGTLRAVLSILTGKQNDASYKGSDLDLFLVGLKPEELIPKVNSIIEQIKSTLPPAPKKPVKDRQSGKVNSASNSAFYSLFNWAGQREDDQFLIIKGFNAITLVPPKSVAPRRTIQIILPSYKTAFDALAWFDLDACAVGFDGENVFAVPRAVRALALGANLLDVKLARKGDPTSSIASSRAFKYLPRGFSLSLPPAAQAALAAAGVDFNTVLAAGRAKAARETELTQVKTETTSGLGGMLRREWNFKNGIVGGRDEAPFGADYGPANSEWMRLVTDTDLLRCQNGTISHEFWEHATKTMAPAISNLLRAEKKDMSKSTVYTYAGDVIFSSYVVPYVASFDNEFVLYIKEAKPDPFKQAWSTIQNLQYIVKLPRSVLPIIDKAEQKLKDIAAAADAQEDAASPAKRAKADEEELASPKFAPEHREAIKRALEALKDVEVPQPVAIKKDAERRVEPFIPDSFPGPFARAGALLSSSRKVAEPVGAKGKKSNASKSVLNPLLDLYGEESLKTKKTNDFVYRLAVLGGLWQFRGLDADVDKAVHVIWQAWVATACAATSIPTEFPRGLEFLLGPRELVALKAQYAAQMPLSQVLAQLTRDVGRLEKVFQAGEGKGMREVGAWDEDRKRFLVQWVKDEEMV
ncbi:hypothetical protein JCM10449v2_007849 [Rhodotorula kratochvilovae]